MSVIELSTTAKTYRELQAEIKELEAQADALKQQMIKELDVRQEETVQAGEYTIRYNIFETSRFDSKKFQADHFNLHAQYIKKVAQTRFQVA